MNLDAAIQQRKHEDAMDTENRLRLEISAGIASLRFFWPWLLVAALPRCAFVGHIQLRSLGRIQKLARKSFIPN
jgi:hypothetical protein